MASYQMYMNIAGANLATAWTHGERFHKYPCMLLAPALVLVLVHVGVVLHLPTATAVVFTK